MCASDAATASGRAHERLEEKKFLGSPKQSRAEAEAEQVTAWTGAETGAGVGRPAEQAASRLVHIYALFVCLLFVCLFVGKRFRVASAASDRATGPWCCMRREARSQRHACHRKTDWAMRSCGGWFAEVCRSPCLCGMATCCDRPHLWYACMAAEMGCAMGAWRGVWYAEADQGV
eukprot:jgi/Ulvmu1/6341/UM029_0049.1